MAVSDSPQRSKTVPIAVGRRQVLAAVLSFALPLSLMPLGRSRGALGRWERVRGWPGPAKVRWLAVGQRPYESDYAIYAAGPAGDLYVSTDEGAVWRRAGLSPSPGMGLLRLLDLAVNPARPSELHAVLASRQDRPRPMVYSSEDAGLSWHVQSALGPRRVQALSYGAGEYALYMVSGGDVVRALVTEGNSHRLVSDGSELQEAVIGSLDTTASVTGLVVSDGTNDQRSRPERLLYVATESHGLWVFIDHIGVTGGDPPSEDSGTNSGPSVLPLGDDTSSAHVRARAKVNAIAVHPSRRNIVLASTNLGLHISTDRGTHWQHLARQMRHRLLCLLYSPDGDVLYAGSAGKGVLRSEDNGATWSRLGYGLGPISVLSLSLVPSEPGVLYAGSDRGLWRIDHPTQI